MSADTPRHPLGPGEPNGHPSALTIEQLAFGEDDVVVDEAVMRHVAVCVECMRRVVTLREERAAYQAMHPSATFVALLDEKMKVSRFRDRFRAAVLAAPLMAALGAAGVYLVSSLAPESPPAGIKMKGAVQLALRVHVSRDGQPAVPFDVRDELNPGDVLRFVADVPKPGYAALLSIDEHRRINWYYPVEGAANRTIAAGQGIVLPGAIELDDYVGRELLVLFVSDSTGERRAIEKHVRNAITIANGDLTSLHRRGLGSHAVSVLVTKRKRR